MKSIRTKIHFFVVENKSTQQKFRVKFKDINYGRCGSYSMQVIEGKNFFDEEYMSMILLEVSYDYSGIGSTTEAIPGHDIVIHFDIAR